MSSDTISYTRIHADSDGTSHFEDIDVTMASMSYAPPAPPMAVSDPIEADRFVFVGAATGWVGDWHPSPKRQFVFFLGGVFQVRVGDGETRRFGPGDVLLLEDTVGQGHFSQVISKESGLMAMVHLE
uniref:Cupin domain-containing protein n=1 Tax=Candidatus Kentrum eta TaxID=2126337 RepID=A0A450V629_9GAMM|nr:MAG: hypothetical protein BECKH772A_GA0070896_100929 [Candidatus Kentron sp. H]VFK00221.1 MAG: hypothetical protein BECKH772B_GA0070898_101829 [Candidatus Kentron sp. H]VFK04452.1 MAG: hypothetical protein BECKH772C_GA0070978_101829 [Candidatus Kentron sp. H]